MIDQRIAERRARVRDERRRTRLRRTVTLTVLSVVVVAGVLIERSPLVGLEEVRVLGTQRLDPEEVRAAAGLELGTSTLRLPLRAATSRVEALPLVRSVEVRRADPLTVLIEVEERQPVVVVEGAGVHRLLDRDGVVLADGALEGLPRIVLGGRPPDVGAHAGDAPALANAHRAWRGITGPLRSQVTALHAAGPDELTLRLSSGIEVRFGRAERIDEKVRAIGAVLADIGSSPVEMIDVRAPSAPVVHGG